MRKTTGQPNHNRIKRAVGIGVATLLATAAMTPAAFAVTADVDGEIGFQTTSITYDVAFDTTTVNWYVTEHSNGAVWNSPTSTNTQNPHSIQNNSRYDQRPGGNTYAVPVKVTLDFQQDNSTNQDAQAIESALTLNFTGDLAADGMGSTNLSRGLASPVVYPTALAGNGRWDYGFTGTYAGTVNPSTNLNPNYQMEITVSAF